MDDKLRQRIYDLSIELIADEDIEIQCLGSHIQAGLLLTEFKVMSIVLVEITMPTVVALMVSAGIEPPTDKELEESGKRLDVEILKAALKKGM